MILINNAVLRRWLRVLLPCVGIPLLVMASVLFADERHYLAVSLGVAALAVVLFTAGFEKKIVGSRRAVLVAVMTALCVVSRMIPVFKPVTAIVVLSALYLGREAGFLVGALSALVSNMYFGQGPWTPFQMLALGLIAYAAGVMSALLKAHRLALVLYGVLSGVLYSLIMDVWTVLWYHGGFSVSLYLAATVTALAHTVIYAVSNAVFLWVLKKPIGDRLERIRVKYDI